MSSEAYMHVVPCDDLVEHYCSPRCWCMPKVTSEGIVIHNAADDREVYEQRQWTVHRPAPVYKH